MSEDADFNEPPEVATAPPIAPESPRLTIMHLLVWTALVAALMAVQKLPDRADHLYANRVGSPWQFFQAFNAIRWGIQLGAVLILVNRWRQGIAFPRQPGEWLLLIGAAWQIPDLIGRVVRAIYIGKVSTPDIDFATIQNLRESAWDDIPFMIGCGLALLVTVAALIVLRAGTMWTLVFVAEAIALAIFLINEVQVYNREYESLWNDLSVGLKCVLAFLPSALTFVAAGVDLARHRSRGWLHGAGVVEFTIRRVVSMFGPQVMLSIFET